MSCKLRGRLREPEKLRGEITGMRVVGPDGVYREGSFQGEANGWYNANLPGLVPVGLWDASGNRSDANEWYDNNVPAPVPVGLWDGLGGRTDANGYYVDNAPAPIPDGCYRNGGLVDPYYEAIIKAAQAEGGGLYLFQLEHGQYAGEQVIWQEMGELTPWVPGLSTPQGKVLDLMGSGEYLGQSVSMRRPVDGAWDGVGTWMDASSDAVGGHLHQSKPSAWFAGLESISAISNAAIIATGRASSTEDGIEVRNNNAGILQYFRSGATSRGTLTVAGLGISPGLGWHVVGVSQSDTRRKVIADGSVVLDLAAPAPYPDEPAAYLLKVGSQGGGQLIHARYTYIAIYTREPTAHEISLHKRTP